MRGKIVFVIILSAVIGGLGAFPNIFSSDSKPKAMTYKPYNFDARDHAELVITKFIRAIETGDNRVVALLLEKDTKYNRVIKIITEFYNNHYQGKAKKYFILYPGKFTFSDSMAIMEVDVKNTTDPRKNKEASLYLVNKENQWLIKPSSPFFKILDLLSDKAKKEKEM